MKNKVLFLLLFLCSFIQAQSNLIWESNEDLLGYGISLNINTTNGFDIQIDQNGDIVAMVQDRWDGIEIIKVFKFSEEGILLWEHTQFPLALGSARGVMGNDFKINDDNEIILLAEGYNEFDSNQNTAYYFEIFKLSENGEVIWNAILEDFRFSGGELSIDENDNIYVSGTDLSNSDENSAILLSLSDEGVMQWNNSIPACSVTHQLKDGQIQVFGQNDSCEDGILINIYNLNGSLVSTVETDHNNVGSFYTTDLQGNVYTSTRDDYGLQKFDSEGNLLWKYQKPSSIPVENPNNYFDRVTLIYLDEQLNIYIVGQYHGEQGGTDTHQNLLTTKLNPNGELIWENHYTYEGNDTDEKAIDIALLDNGQILIVGTIRDEEEQDLDGLVLILGDDGQIEWSHLYQENDAELEIIHSVVTMDNHFYLLGIQGIGFTSVMSVRKLDRNLITSSHLGELVSNDFYVFPNPTTSELYFSDLEGLLEAFNIRLLDRMGKETLFIADYNEDYLDIPSFLANGIYILRLEDENVVKQTKVVIQR